MEKAEKGMGKRGAQITGKRAPVPVICAQCWTGATVRIWNIANELERCSALRHREELKQGHWVKMPLLTPADPPLRWY